jgi:hypothetical protein
MVGGGGSLMDSMEISSAPTWPVGISSTPARRKSWIGGEPPDEMQALPVRTKDGDGNSRRRGLQECAQIGERKLYGNRAECADDNDRLRGVLGDARGNAEGVRRRALRGRGCGIIGATVFLETGEGLWDAVFKQGEVGGLETVRWIAVRVGDDDVEDDEAGGDVEGGDWLAGVGRSLGGADVGDAESDGCWARGWRGATASNRMSGAMREVGTAAPSGGILIVEGMIFRAANERQAKRGMRIP